MRCYTVMMRENGLVRISNGLMLHSPNKNSIFLSLGYTGNPNKKSMNMTIVNLDGNDEPKIVMKKVGPSNQLFVDSCVIKTIESTGDSFVQPSSEYISRTTSNCYLASAGRFEGDSIVVRVMTDNRKAEVKCDGKSTLFGSGAFHACGSVELAGYFSGSVRATDSLFTLHEGGKIVIRFAGIPEDYTVINECGNLSGDYVRPEGFIEPEKIAITAEHEVATNLATGELEEIEG